MSSLPPQQAERAALCDLMLQLGPDRPTLCEGWTTYDMAAHLYVREHDPVAAVGIVVAQAASMHDQAITRTKDRTPFESLVGKVRSGPPMLIRPVDGLINTQEFFVHHEDVRRGGDDTTPRPEDDTVAVERSLWSTLHRSHVMMTHKVKGARVELVAPGYDTIRAGKGDEAVTITGRPGEIVLFLLGRGGAAHVEIDGSPTARASLDAARFGI